MGAVHGVYLKYVGLSAASFAGYQFVVGNFGPLDPLGPMESLPSTWGLGLGARMLATSGSSTTASGSDGTLITNLFPLLRLGTAAVLSYSTFLNGAIAIMFRIKRGMSLIGKDVKKGTIPRWSYLLFFPFHLPTYAYTYLHCMKDKRKKVPVPMASEVQPGWWVGGCRAHELNKRWAGIIDLTVEFPEKCRSDAVRYLCLPSWDGVPCSPENLEKAALFCQEAREHWTASGHEGEPQILIHCAHGRGRSTTVMCAALVKAGLFSNWEQAFEKGIRPQRPVCKLNSMMKKNLTEWQEIYVDGKKGT